MAYALNINNRRVINAMEALGIDQSELLKVTIEDFAGPHVKPEIQKLRFEYHERKVQDTVRRIRQWVKDEQTRAMLSQRLNYMGDPSKINDSLNGESLRKTMDDLMYDQDQRFDRLRKEFQQQISNTKSQIDIQKNREKTIQQKRKRTKNKESYLKAIVETTQQKLQKFHQKAQENKERLHQQKEQEHKRLLQKIKSQGANAQARENEMKSKIRQEMMQKEQNYREKQARLRREKEEEENQRAQELLGQLRSLESRIEEKHWNYQQELQKKIERSKEYNAKVIDANRKFKMSQVSTEQEKVMQIINKQKEVERRRIQLMEIKRAKMLQDKEKLELKLQNAKQVTQQMQEKKEREEKRLERRISSSKNVLDKMKKDWEYKLEIRQEQQKLKDADKALKVARAKRIFDKRRMDLLEKYYQDSQRVQNFKQEREAVLQRQRDLALKSMIERERTKELIAQISKTPDSKSVRELLKSLSTRTMEKEEST